MLVAAFLLRIFLLLSLTNKTRINPPRLTVKLTNLKSWPATTTPSIKENNKAASLVSTQHTTMDTIGKYQRQVDKLKKVINEGEDPNLARSHQEQLDKALTNLENATTAYAKRTTRKSGRIAKRKVRTLQLLFHRSLIIF